MTYPPGSPRGWDPFGELQALRSELGRLVGLVGGGRGPLPGVQLQQTDSGWTVTAALPGVAPEEVAVDLEDRELCIRARTEAEVNQEIGLSGGSRQRGFEYRVALPAEVDADRVDATMDHGLLTVRLPRSSRQARRTITVARAGATSSASTAAPPVPAPSGDPADVVDGDPAADREMHHHHHRPHDAPPTVDGS